jgi:hypothetical protein
MVIFRTRLVVTDFPGLCSAVVCCYATKGSTYPSEDACEDGNWYHNNPHCCTGARISEYSVGQKLWNPLSQGNGGIFTWKFFLIPSEVELTHT